MLSARSFDADMIIIFGIIEKCPENESSRDPTFSNATESLYLKTFSPC